MIRFFDLFFSIIGLIILSPFFIIVSIWIKIDSAGPVFYKQTRVGLNGVDFELIKFRSMFIDSEKKGLLTVGENDKRITRSGRFIRKYKLDELPQLINVLIGQMSFVGPRPEVRKYVNKYNQQQKKVLQVRPGITDYASLVYRHENDILSKVDNPEYYYITVVMPQKLELNMEFIRNRNLMLYFKLIFITIFMTFNFSQGNDNKL